jgi:hypothetical protein
VRTEKTTGGKAAVVNEKRGSVISTGTPEEGPGEKGNKC